MSAPDVSIALVDYGAGNLASVRKALQAVGARVFTPRQADDLGGAAGIIVPGVGHFDATRSLDAAWRAGLSAAVAAGTPLLGICLGMQWLFDASDEAPGLDGLGVFAGRCWRLGQGAEPPVKVPHVGWNALVVDRPSRILHGIPSGAQAYFTHSYAVPTTGDAVASTEHGGWFPSVVERGRVMGVQFHPEKSGTVGLGVLANFVRCVSGLPQA